MSTEEIKRQIFEGINNIDDNDFLLTIKEMVDHKYSHASDPKLANWQKERITESEKQINEGDYLTNQQANELFNKWLNE
jgi:hypothetical protein